MQNNYLTAPLSEIWLFLIILIVMIDNLINHVKMTLFLLGNINQKII
jgi:hypothetical protein